MATLAIENCNDAKYGSLKTSLASNYARGLDQYPSTVDRVSEILEAHQWDADGENEESEEQVGSDEDEFTANSESENSDYADEEDETSEEDEVSSED